MRKRHKRKKRIIICFLLLIITAGIAFGSIKIYLDKKTHRPIQRIVYSKAIEDGEERVSIATDSYQYEIGTVTDEEVKEVDLTGYKIEDRRQNNLQ